MVRRGRRTRSSSGTRPAHQHSGSCATSSRSENPHNNHLRHHLCVIYLTETCWQQNNSIRISKVNLNSSLLTTCTKRGPHARLLASTAGCVRTRQPPFPRYLSRPAPLPSEAVPRPSRHIRPKPLSQSFRGSAAGREPGIHNHCSRSMDSGLASASLRRPGMTRLTKVDALAPRSDQVGFAPVSAT